VSRIPPSHSGPGRSNGYLLGYDAVGVRGGELRGSDAFEASGGKAAVQAMLNGKAMNGWEFVESHLAPDGDGRYYVFRRPASSQ
jgi:hypothetical protein